MAFVSSALDLMVWVCASARACKADYVRASAVVNHNIMNVEIMPRDYASK